MAAVTTQHQQQRIRWQTVWTALIVAFWGLIVVGVVGDYFFNLHFLDFKANGTLWNWLQLLSAPVFVSVLPFVFKGPHASSEHKVDEPQKQPDARLSEQSTSTELQIEDQRQQEAVIEAYLSHMSELLLEKNLRSSAPGSDAQEVAQALTLTALRRVDKSRKGAVLQFLHEAGLIYKAKPIIDLSGTDLRGIDLSKAKLNVTNICQVDLSGANLSGANLN
ncbi:MAG: pentapeptide repeat-containing protein, partial [Chloroflexota bacterium]|nr:pentapeptide repeat-containing protein [Chloroflexota bacterium]